MVVRIDEDGVAALIQRLRKTADDIAGCIRAIEVQAVDALRGEGMVRTLASELSSATPRVIAAADALEALAERLEEQLAEMMRVHGRRAPSAWRTTLDVGSRGIAVGRHLEHGMFDLLRSEGRVEFDACGPAVAAEYAVMTAARLPALATWRDGGVRPVITALGTEVALHRGREGAGASVAVDAVSFGLEVGWRMRGLEVDARFVGGLRLGLGVRFSGGGVRVEAPFLALSISARPCPRAIRRRQRWRRLTDGYAVDG